MKDSIEFLKATKAVIQNPQNWTQRTWARDLSGVPVEPDEETATCFCTMGALRRVMFNECGYYDSSNPRNYAQAWDLKTSSEMELHKYAMTYANTIAGFNDNKTHSEVMDMFDAVIRVLEMEKNVEDNASKSH